MTRREANNQLRLQHLKRFMDFAISLKEDVIQTKSNEFCYPVLNSNNDEEFIRIAIQVPNGTKDEAFDGYELGVEYQRATEKAEEVRREKEIAKLKKIEKDQQRRKKKKEEIAEIEKGESETPTAENGVD